MYNGNILPNTWHCIVNTFDNGIQKLYVDGVLSQTIVPFNQSKTCTNTDFVIGSWWQSDPHRFKGKMDEIRFYDRAINQDEVNALCVLSACNNWLHTQAIGESVKVGDLDVSGNQITVEGNFNCTSFPISGADIWEEIVSKHSSPSDCNYALRMNMAAITTTDGFFLTPASCDNISLNKTYHVAMVYDGNTLKFYRDGFLMSQVAATGNLVLNDLLTTIGDYAYSTPLGTNFFGYLNEIRIWNVARTQSQIRVYMNSSLPNPTTQTGLLAYYTFDNLINKQGNTTWNGTLSGAATISNTNPNCDFIPDSCNVITSITSFTAPDTVCVNEPVQVVNTSVGATDYYWSFCESTFAGVPDAVNLGNPGGFASLPVFEDIAKDDLGNYYGFMVNNTPSGLIRYDFGNSLLNTPVANFLGNPGGALPIRAEGIRIVKAGSNWIGVVVGGAIAFGDVPAVTTINFGVSITNNFPTATNWGNIGNMNYPVEVFVFTENNNWYGYTVNADNNTITKFNFGADFTTPPTAVNLGNLGGLNGPTGIGEIKDGTNWYLFITNETNNTITRLNFGNSLLNTATGTNLGTLGGAFSKPRDISFIRLCDGITGLAVNGQTSSITKLDFQNNITGTPVVSSLGNIGSLNFPHSISKLFRENNDIYAFIPNVNSNTITRLRFLGCQTVPGSALQTPAPISYSIPGTYNINLTTDIGLPTQSSFCKKIVVRSCIVPTTTSFTAPDTVCVNEPVQVVNTSTGTSTYYWSFCEANTGSPIANNLGNPGSTLARPTFSDIVQDDAGNYYVFVTSNVPESVTRLSYGNSLLNVPVAQNLGNFGGILPVGAEGIQVMKVNSNWIAVVVGGDVAISRIIKLEFGTSLSNAPTATNWGNIGGLAYPHDLYVFTENNNWYGYTINALGNSLTRFEFGADFSTAPVGTNLGNLGGMDIPVGIGAIKNAGNWHLFITNGGNSDLIRLDFGNSLLNAPTAVNLGNPGNVLSNPRDISFIDLCEGIEAFSVNADNNTIAKLDFGNNLLSVPAGTSLGNLGALNFPHSISKFFHVNNDIYGFIPIVNTNSITRMRFAGCSGIPGSTLQNPPPVTYTTAGTYSINLLTDIGLVTQGSFCKQIVVQDCIVPGISNIINDYTPVLALNPCNNSITVEDGTAFHAGDTVLLIQMKGAGIDSTNTAAFGTVTDYKNSGNYEFNYVKAATGNIIELKNKITRQYTIPDGKVQLVRVPYYYSVNVSSTLTCLPWDGSKGGILAFNVRDTLRLNADINVTGKGFRKGIMHNSLLNAFTCGLNDYFSPVNTIFAAGKGESIADLSDAKDAGKGAKASAGGGGMDPNSGGGGGGNGNVGGVGGWGYQVCPNYNTINDWGLGGNPLNYNPIANKIFLGGAGGAGHCNNGFDDPTLNTDMDGGNGGGLVIISSNYLEGNNNNIVANGDTAYELVAPGFLAHDGMGGGGAGGTILLSNNNFLSNVNVTTLGGKGADMSSSPVGGLVGPGGGGAGGVLWVKQAAVPGNITVTNTGGNNGVIIQNGNSPNGATPGQDGINVFSLVIPVDTVLFKPNIDSVRIKDSNTICRNFDFHGFAYTNTTGITSWHWDFGDTHTANTQNASNTYSSDGTYNVTLIATDINGCKDSIIKQVTVINCANAISNIINDYTPVIALNPCNNSITVENGTAYNVGDTVLIIQMKGAVVDSTNTAAFGNITDYKNAGNYEFNYVKARTGNIIELKNKLTRQYDIPVGKVQLIRVPYYTSAVVSATLTCLPWDGSKGGVLVLNARDTVTLNANIDVSANGFPGAIGQNTIHPPVFNCFESNFYYLGTSYDSASKKGEGISFISNNRILGKGKIANAGGGGNSHNSGGGGGANGGQGGFGGYQFEGCGATPFDNRGIGGTQLTYNNAANKIFMGGGGGAGQANNFDGFSGNGGNGGAIAIIMAGTLINNGNNIINNGQDAVACSLGGTGCHEGMGGGGSGGTTLLKVPNFVNNVPVNCIGGKGGDMVQAGNQRVGPGGGGGGGIVWFNAAIQPANVPSLTTGGLNGTCTAYGLDPWGATPGNGGSSLLNLVIPVDTVLFKPNIDSVRIKDSNIICRNFDFHGFAYTNTTGIASWHWNFGDTHTANTQDASNTYSSNGTYNVTLVATDLNGCKDSIIKQVTVVNCLNSISGVINDYTPALGFDPCNNQLTVLNAAAFNPGDTVLLIQMKGAVIDSVNTTSFGTVTDYKNAGNYEYNFVQSKVGNVITFLNKLTHQYDIPAGRVQLIRVPYYNSTVVTSTLTCLPWDGTKGGVLAFNVRDTLTLNADMDVSNKGFRGGGTGNAFNCTIPEYATASGTTGFKGESIAELNAPWNGGGGHLANGGGGSMGGNSGAGGGSNLVAAGIGGREFNACANLQSIGGQALTNNANSKVYLGGGGGGGQQDNGFPIYPGGNGGGIVFISTNHFKGNSFNINANGFSRSEVIHDEGGAAGGGGGSVVLIANNFINTVNVKATGGDGNSNNNTSFPINCHGPGGGGSGGVIFVKQPALSINITPTLTGGNAGLVLNPASTCFNTTHGAANGANGTSIGNFVLTRDTILFVPNIDSVRIHDSATSCTGFDFHGLGYTNTTPIVTWDWDFGDASSHANTQNTSHTYSGTGPYTVHLIGTDINGCKDSITTTVSLNTLTVNAGNDTAFCSSGPVTHTLHGVTTGAGYSWTPAGLLDNNTLQNPTATISATTMFYLNTSGVGGCTAIDSVLLTVNPLPAVSTINDFSICKLDSMLLTTVTNATTIQWSPTLSVNDPTIASPYFIDTVSQQMIITGTITATGCIKKDTVNVTIKPLPAVISIPDTSLCGPHNVTLTTTGAQTYTWLPATNLSNPSIGNPVFTGSTTQTYTVTGTGANSCKAKDTVTITVHPQPAVSTISDISICRGDSIQLNTTTDAQTNQWSPSTSVSDPNIPNPYFHDTVSQQMIITGTNATGCFDKDTVNITVKPLPVVHTIPDSALCGPRNITLTTTGAQTYSWTPATDLSSTTIASPVFTGTATQTYTVTGTAANACVAKDTVTITVNAVPVVSTIANASICKGDSIQLISNSNAGSNSWSPAGSVNNPTITNPYFIDTVSQTMTITGTNSGTGCFSTATVNITVKPLPNVRTINDFTSCAVNTVTLTTTGAQTYSWTPATNLDDPASANPIFTGPVGTYTYYVTGTGVNGCISKDSVNVSITPKPVFTAPENGSICIHDTIVLNGNNGPNYQYTWSPGTTLSNPAIINPTANPTVTTIYSLLIEDHVCNSDSTFTVTVTVNPIPTVSATKSNDLDCGTPESQLIASGASHYLWTPSDELSSPYIYNPVASPYVTTQYIVIGTDVNGCSNQDTITVIRKGGKYFGFNIPNSFTPNGDGLNDCFGVTYWGQTSNFHLMIYNRWGNKVFETYNVAECWDGRYKGNPCEVGNYVFYLKGETLCGPVTKKGNLLLIR
ncbi:MAG: PKD domain-containing protein [Ferruginibacter sp.]